MRQFFYFILLLFITGCNSGTNTSSDDLSPKIIFNKVFYNDSNISGSFTISEMNKKYFDVEFSNIQLKDGNCIISNVTLNKNSIKEGQTIDFNATLNCPKNEIPTIKVEFLENARYIDVSTKNVSKLKTVETILSSNSNNYYQVFLSNETINVQEGDSYTINITIFDENGNPVSVPVKISPPIGNDGKLYGEFNTYLFSTNSNGKGTFIYTAPSSINNEVNLTVPILINNSITKNLNIIIQKKPQDITPTPTKLVLFPSQIYISENSINTIKVLTLDENNRPVSSTVLLAAAIDNDNNVWGTFNTFTITTNESGEGEVTFNAASDFSKIKDQNLSIPFTIQSTSITANLILTLATTQINENEIILDIATNIPESVNLKSDFGINIQIKNSKNDEIIDANYIRNITLSSENHLIYFDNNSSTINFTKKNNFTLSATSSTVSGIDIIDINASVDINGTIQNINKQVPITVLSGPVSSISINKVSSSYNADLGLFEDIYSIHAVDKYSNPVNAGTQISVGAIVNKKLIGENGVIGPLNDEESEFNDSDKNFSNSVEIEDTLVVLADENHTSPSYLGGWIINSINSDHSLTLASSYNGEVANNLKYIIGNERRYIDGAIYVADFDSENKTYTTDAYGNALIKLRYDPPLIGKTISLYVNSYQDKRVGASLKTKLIPSSGVLVIDSDNSATQRLWSVGSEINTNQTGWFFVYTNEGITSIYDEYGNLITTNGTKFIYTPVYIQILTPNICKFDDNTLEKNVTTDDEGYAYFTVKYEDNGTCDVIFTKINYEY